MWLAVNFPSRRGHELPAQSGCDIATHSFWDITLPSSRATPSLHSLRGFHSPILHCFSMTTACGVLLSPPSWPLHDYHSLWCSILSFLHCFSMITHSLWHSTLPLPSWTLHDYTQPVMLHSKLFCGHREPINVHTCPLRQIRETYLSHSIGTNRALLKI